MLDKAATLAKAIFDEHIVPEPALRQGSYSNAMEECVHLTLNVIWLECDCFAQPVEPSLR